MKNDIRDTWRRCQISEERYLCADILVVIVSMEFEEALDTIKGDVEF